MWAGRRQVAQVPVRVALGTMHIPSFAYLASAITAPPFPNPPRSHPTGAVLPTVPVDRASQWRGAKRRAIVREPSCTPSGPGRASRSIGRGGRSPRLHSARRRHGASMCPECSVPGSVARGSCGTGRRANEPRDETKARTSGCGLTWAQPRSGRPRVDGWSMRLSFSCVLLRRVVGLAGVRGAGCVQRRRERHGCGSGRGAHCRRRGAVSQNKTRLQRARTRARPPSTRPRRDPPGYARRAGWQYEAHRRISVRRRRRRVRSREGQSATTPCPRAPTCIAASTGAAVLHAEAVVPTRRDATAVGHCHCHSPSAARLTTPHDTERRALRGA